jgi:hypothetical protein
VVDTATQSVVNQWTISNRDYAIAVTNGTIALGGFAGAAGSLFTTSGVSLGALPGNQQSIYAFDGTTDGTHNYGQDFGTGRVLQFDADWTNPTVLFTGISKYALGITYDNSNNSLWVGGRSATIANYSLNGTLLSSFANPLTGSDTQNEGNGSGLAMDSEGYLWELSNSTLTQLNRTGTVLQQFSISGLTQSNNLGIEASITGPTAAPEPGSIVLAMAGLAGITFLTKRLSVRNLSRS